MIRTFYPWFLPKESEKKRSLWSRQTCDQIGSLFSLEMGVSLNGGTPISHPKSWSFLVGKPMVVGYHHFRKPPNGDCSKDFVGSFFYPEHSLGKHKNILQFDPNSSLGRAPTFLEDSRTRWWTLTTQSIFSWWMFFFQKLWMCLTSQAPNISIPNDLQRLEIKKKRLSFCTCNDCVMILFWLFLHKGHSVKLGRYP